jgi:hypothetical protein
LSGVRRMTRTHGTCRGCGKPLDSPSHRDRSEAYCFILNEKRIRSRARPRVKYLEDVYRNGKLKSEFIGTDMEDKLMRRQQQLALDAVLGLSDNGYRLPRNLDTFMAGGYVWNQIAVKRPWAVYVLVNGKRKRRRFNNLYEAIEWHKKIYPKYPSSGIVSLARAFDLPAHWRLRKDKLPRRFKWCPHCGAFRVFRRVDPPQRFCAIIKSWNPETQRWRWAERMVWLTECQLCGHTNRSPVFRRSNQPWELRKIKPRVTRVKPRIRTKRGRAQRSRRRRG